MSMPQDPAMAPQGGPPQGDPGGGGNPIHMLLQMVAQAAQAIDQVGQVLSQLAGPQGPPQGGPPPGGPGGGDPRQAAIANMVQRGG